MFECEYSELGGDAPASFFVVLSDNGLKEDGSIKANSTYYFLDIYAHNYDDKSDGLQLDLISNTVGSYELSGEYVISKSQEKFTAYPGYANGSYMEGSWYFNADYSQYAPLVDGDVYITNNGDTTFTIEVDAYDDAGNNIYGSWTGVDPNQAQTFNCQSLVVNNRGMKNKAFSPMTKAMLK